MEPFVDKHREELIRKVTNVDPILEDLKDLLKKENYEYLKSRQTSKEKMEALFGYVSGWNKSYKDRLYELLKKHEEEIIRDLEKQERGESELYFIPSHQYHTACTHPKFTKQLTYQCVLSNFLTVTYYISRLNWWKSNTSSM
ncbi:apoptosis-associated speck-like protein containing a CARD [Lithobates pipiens]